jgi:tetratricopeptide (TPR) repeat protein
MIQHKKFIFDSILDNRECKDIEFKLIGQKHISHESVHYLVGFINARIIGKIYFGVEDGSRQIKGIELSEEERDRISRIIFEKIKEIVPLKEGEPLVPLDCYAVEIYDVWLDENSKRKDTYLIEVSVLEIPNKVAFLYKTTQKGDVYYKQGTQNPKLKKNEIRVLLEQRTYKRSKDELEVLKTYLADPDFIIKEEHISKLTFLAGKVQSTDDMRLAWKLSDSHFPNSNRLREEIARVQKYSGDPDSALLSWEEIKRNSSTEDGKKLASLEISKIYRDQHNISDAMKNYDEILKTSPNDYVTLALKGTALMEEYLYYDAIILLKKSLKINPRYRFAKYKIQECFSLLKK